MTNADETGTVPYVEAPWTIERIPSSMTTFLVSSAGRRGALVQILKEVAAKRGGGKVVAVDASPLSAAGRLADAFEIVPLIHDEAFTASVLEIATRHGVDVVIPTIDPEIAVYAQNRAHFADAGIDVWAPSIDCARLGFDKWLLHTWMLEHDIPTVETFEIGDESWKSLDGSIVFKPRRGSSSIGVHRSSSIEAAPADLADDYIVQSHAPGIELTVDFAVDRRGRFLGAVPRHRLEVRAGEVSKGVTVRSAAALDVAEQLATSMPGLYGVSNAQMFYDKTAGTINVIELNPRFGGGYPLTHAAGADLVSAVLDADLGDAPSPVTWQDGLTMLRYDAAVFVNDRNAVLP